MTDFIELVKAQAEKMMLSEKEQFQVYLNGIEYVAKYAYQNELGAMSSVCGMSVSSHDIARCKSVAKEAKRMCSVIGRGRDIIGVKL